ncbi:hypothetical protein KKA02_00755, partial [Patescibacteria group bacterium]|nr:hypothetical protein [Patescibacteria group bacterium]
MAKDGQNSRRSDLFEGTEVDTKVKNTLDWQVGYATVGQVLKGLEGIKNLSEADRNLVGAINAIFGQMGKNVPDNIESIVSELGVFPAETAIADATEELWEKIKSELEIEAEEIVEVAEKKMGTRALDKQELEKLLAEYEAYLKSKTDEGSAIDQLVRKYNIERSQVTEWIQRYKEAHESTARALQESKLTERAGISATEKELIINILAREEVVEIGMLENVGLSEEKAKEVVAKTTEATVEKMLERREKEKKGGGDSLGKTIEEIKSQVEKSGVLRDIGSQTTDGVIVRLGEMAEIAVVKAEIEVKADRLARVFVKGLKENGVLADKDQVVSVGVDEIKTVVKTDSRAVREERTVEVVKSRIKEVWAGEVGSLVETRLETAVDETGGLGMTKVGLFQDLVRKIEPDEQFDALVTSVKELDVIVEATANKRTNREVFGLYKAEKVVEKAVTEFIEINSDEGLSVEEVATFSQYAKTTIRMVYAQEELSPVDKNNAGLEIQRLNTENPELNVEASPLRMEEADVFTRVCRINEEEFRGIVSLRERLIGTAEDPGVLYKVKMPVEGIFGKVDQIVELAGTDSQFGKFLGMVQEKVAFFERFNTRNLAWKVAEKFGVQGKVIHLAENIGTKIGIQGAGEMAGNFMAMAAKEGFRNALKKAVFQLASGAGKVAASGGAAVAEGAAGTAVAGAGTAAA